MQTSNYLKKTTFVFFFLHALFFQIELSGKSVFYESRFDISLVCFEEKKEFKHSESSDNAYLNTSSANFEVNHIAQQAA